MKFAAVLVCLLATFALEAQANKRVIVPFKFSDQNHMLVPISINDHQTTGVLDTAATIAMIDSRSAMLGGIKPPNRDAPSAIVRGIAGVSEYQIVHIGSIKAGSAELGEVDAAFNPNFDLSGAASNILPFSVFPGDVVEFDFSRMQISSYNGRPDNPETDNIQRIRYIEDRGLLFAEIRINGKKGRALVDTGANVSYVNSAFEELANMRSNAEKARMVVGATTGDAPIRVATARVQLGGFHFNHVDLFVVDTEFFTDFGLNEEPVMVLGLDLLSAFRVQFDRRKNRMILILPEIDNDNLRLDLRSRGSRIRD